MNSSSNQEKARLRSRIWAQNNPERNRQRASEWYYKNRERALIRIKSRAKDKKNDISEYKKSHYRANAKKYKDKAAAWGKNNPEKVRSKQSRYRKNNKGKICHWAQKRRALVALATINLKQIKAWMEVVKSKPSALCYYCGKRVSTKSIHFDHIVALAEGGPHCIENLCVSCVQCNCSKNVRPIRAWIKMGQQILEL